MAARVVRELLEMTIGADLGMSTKCTRSTARYALPRPIHVRSESSTRKKFGQMVFKDLLNS